MDRGDSLEAATLETLPITAAVVDESGEILFTNENWRSFAGAEGREAGADVGRNYLVVSEDSSDEHARRAAQGIRELLSGERQAFDLEYPCHSPNEKRWFLLRASRFTVDGEARATILHLDITERKLAEQAAAESADRFRREREALDHVLDRIDGLVRDVTDVAVDARSREEVERGVCERLVSTDPYVLAWIGSVDVTTSRIKPREWCARDGVGLEDDELSLRSDVAHPAVRAIESGETQFVDDLDAIDEGDRFWPTGAEEWFSSVVAVPIAYGDVTYGVLTVFADDGDAFEARERPVLESLAGTIATAINAIESRRLLATDEVVEIELTVGDRSLFLADLSARLDATVGFDGLLYDEGDPVVLFDVDTGPSVVEPVEAVSEVRDCRLLADRDGEVVIEVRLGDGIVRTLLDHGVAVRRLDAADGVVDLALDVSNGRTARSIFDLLSERFDQVELVRYRERERPVRTPTDVAASVEADLTDRQRTALLKAYHADYYAWPRGVSGEELADSMDISRSTFHQHLRSAERRVLDELFAGTAPSSGEGRR